MVTAACCGLYYLYRAMPRMPCYHVQQIGGLPSSSYSSYMKCLRVFACLTRYCNAQLLKFLAKAMACTLAAHAIWRLMQLHGTEQHLRDHSRQNVRKQHRPHRPLHLILQAFCIQDLACVQVAAGCEMMTSSCKAASSACVSLIAAHCIAPHTAARVHTMHIKESSGQAELITDPASKRCSRLCPVTILFQDDDLEDSQTSPASMYCINIHELQNRSVAAMHMFSTYLITSKVTCEQIDDCNRMCDITGLDSCC